MLMTEFVERPKTTPGPPVASMTAIAGKASIRIAYPSSATMPRQCPASSRTSPRNSQASYLRTSPSTS